ncbi:hypothetical protein T01_6456, partial [Trichinella spiralis]
LEMGKALQLAKNLTELLHFQSYLLLEIVRVVSVHKPADQPTVEYEQADVSTASCDETIDQMNQQWNTSIVYRFDNYLSLLDKLIYSTN